MPPELKPSISDDRPVIVISGVNLMNVGPLAIMRDAVAALAAHYAQTHRIIALVHKRELFSTPGVEYHEFPEIKGSWGNRIRFEYFQCRGLSRQWKPKLWLAMHDMTPRVEAGFQAVYCHNPSPFHPFKLKDFRHDQRESMFRLLYRYLYRIHIHANRYVVVQQNWLREEFRRLYKLNNVIVAHPEVPQPPQRDMQAEKTSDAPVFFYPCFPRSFKNIELLLRAARILEKEGLVFRLLLTIDGTENTYARDLRQEADGLHSVEFLGLQSRDRIYDLLREIDCLLFPSKLETWGLPITEAKAFGKPILAADMPYAHETVGDYDQTAFFDVENVEQLAGLMRRFILGELRFTPHHQAPIAQPCTHNWQELFALLLPPA